MVQHHTTVHRYRSVSVDEPAAFNDNRSASASTATANATMPSSSTVSNALAAEPANEKKRTYDEQGNHHDDDDDDDNDDNSDKKNESGLAAFFHYARAHHKQVRAVLMGCNKPLAKPVANVTFGQVAEKLAREYKALPETMIAEYQEMAATSDVDFVKEMKPFSVPTKTRRKKDPDAPKGPVSAYFLYMMANRSKVSAEDPDMGFGAVTKECAVRFKALTDKDRKEWDEKAAADKERYKVQMEAYEKEQEAKKKAREEAGDGSEDDDHEESVKPNKKAKKKPAQEQDKEKTQENAGNEDTAKEADKPKKNKRKTLTGEQKTQEKEDDKSNKNSKKMEELDKEKAQENAGNEKDEEDKPSKKNKRKTLTGEKKTQEKEDDHAKADKPKKKEKRPADAPTWYKSGYTLYMEANRETIQKDNPGMAHSEVSKLGSTNFKALPDFDQQKWLIQATADKARFDREMEVYNSKQEGAKKDEEYKI